VTSASGLYVVQYDPKALKELTELDKPVARRIVKTVDALNADPQPLAVLGHWSATPICGASGLATTA